LRVSNTFYKQELCISFDCFTEILGIITIHKSGVDSKSWKG
jgi:hypothetical protein